MLSKHALGSTEFERFESTVVTRIALHATVEIPDFGQTDVYCTHLTAQLTDLPYPGEMFDSYQAEQAAQIDALLGWIRETAVSGQVVLMGDMNTGPAVGELDAQFADNYAKFTAAGLRNPYLEADSPVCTTCAENTLTGGSGNEAIDHVFFDFGDRTDGLGVPTSERILDETREVETSEGTKQIHLSDHFGVRTTVSLPD